MSATALAHLESLLRTRKLDVTLTTAAPWRRAGAEDRASSGVPSLDRSLGGGFRRGHVSEIVGARSTGRTALLCRTLAAAAARGEAVALIDTCDRFDATSAAALGLDLSQLLWVRDTGDATRALKAMTLILQAGNFGIVALDLADTPARAIRSFPFTTWLRVARVIEGSQTVALLIGAERIARSPGGVSVALGATTATWVGDSSRSRVLHSIDLQAAVKGGSHVPDAAV